MKVGICFLTYNSEDFIAHAVSCAKVALAGLAGEIVVVDNASRDRSVAELLESHPGVHIIRNARNVGYAAGHNIGAGYLLEKECDILAFLNPDAFLKPDTLRRMAAALSETPGAGCVGAVMDHGEGTSARTFRNKPGFLELLVVDGLTRYLPIARGLMKGLLQRLIERRYVPVDRTVGVQEVYAVAGPCIMFPATSFRAIGGFDEGTFLFMEELIVSERLRRIGQRVIGAPQAVYVHPVDGSTGRYRWRSAYYYIRSERHAITEYFGWPAWKTNLLTGLHSVELPFYVLLLLAGRTLRGLSSAGLAPVKTKPSGGSSPGVRQHAGRPTDT
jgi:N-acetylglucosaminyl-diphospho-decaprenol L-rhamnosyltransferase